MHGVVLHPHPVRGESHNQRNTTGEVATQAKPKEMVEVELRNNRTVGIETNHSTMFTLLLELNVVCEQRWIGYSSNCKTVTAEFLH